MINRFSLRQTASRTYVRISYKDKTKYIKAYKKQNKKLLLEKK